MSKGYWVVRSDVILADEYSKYIEKFNPNYKVSSLKAKIYKKPGIRTNSWLPLASKLSVFEQNNNNDQVVVIANFSTMDQIISNIPFLSNGRWYDIFGSYTLDVNENSTYDTFDIPKKTAIIFSNRQWNLNVENRKNVPEDYLYFSCYPNPFNDHLTIKFSTFEDKEIKINIFDLNGKIVYTDELKNISSGENFIKWNGMTNDGLKLSSAVYIVSIVNRTKVYNQKILFLK